MKDAIRSYMSLINITQSKILTNVSIDSWYGTGTDSVDLDQIPTLAVIYVSISIFYIKADCGDPATPGNGTVSTPTGTTEGNPAIYECFVGYMLNGQPIRICLGNGMWSGVEPTCDPMGTRKFEFYIWAATCDFQQCGVLTSVDSDKPVQPPFKLRSSKWCLVISLTLMEYVSD